MPAAQPLESLIQFAAQSPLEDFPTEPALTNDPHCRSTKFRRANRRNPAIKLGLIRSLQRCSILPNAHNEYELQRPYPAVLAVINVKLMAKIGVTK
jgi:hypothetical protein